MDEDNEYDDEDFDNDDFENETVEDESEEELPKRRDDADAVAAATFIGATGSSINVPVVPVEEGMRIWDDVDWGLKVRCNSGATLTELPPHFLGGSLLRCPEGALGSSRSQFQVTSLQHDARLYVVMEVPSGKSPPCNETGVSLTSCLANGQRWLSEAEASPSWQEKAAEGRKPKRPELLMFSTFAPKGANLSFPQVVPTGEPPRGFAVVVPLTAGSFNVTLTSNTELEVRKTIMDEGVMAWVDRDHQYLDVPEYLKHGILFQQPFKDIPTGSVLTVRPNSASTVYVLTERRGGHEVNGHGYNGDGNGKVRRSWAEDLGSSWHLEEAAPRWHELPTMRTYSRYCPGGWPLALPPCHAPPNDGPVFSVVVTPVTAQSSAPLEVSCHNEGFREIEMLSLQEGVPLSRSSSKGILVEVPPWMQGAMLISPVEPEKRGTSRPGFARFALRPAAASVVYALLPASSVAAEYAARWGNGWEARDEAPLWQPEEGLKARLAVVAKRVLPRELLGVPGTSDGTAVEETEVLGLVVKVDEEAFDASVECNNGLELARNQVKETGLAWTDRQNRLAWIPECMKGGLQFRGPHEILTRPGLSLRIRATAACRAFVMIEANYKELPPRNGRGLPELLLQHGWALETAPAPAWQDAASTLKLLSKRCPEGQELLMPLCGEEEDKRMETPLLFMMVVVSLGPERLGEEMRRSFSLWDADNAGGLAMEQLQEILKRLCPQLDDNTRKMVVSQAFASPKGEMRRVIPYEEFVEKLLRFAAVGERQG